ncbi:beta adaptin [Theileria orientalis strain Shintoku]|uniref:Beta adaptin n=1 Tax=Theileria orientalis strain Shintoku TaxID=869250 RepID=J4C819_THEOR|nr:beta adaptin [Theileria orientalis strain Shintoku]BAM40018.1 beta adaptin [Theileria orientalis strain Shintoku]|eukprot:XP_009690319.1 beta adaptin [Theileria orientalis strain Shintoku]
MDKKHFKGSRRSELQELREELQSTDKDKQKEAIKKVIGAMTTGKDVSSLFPDVVNCIQTNNIELKKLVYLYVINYAKVQPELAILAVNTFCKDSSDRNPLIRALAIRTMGYIRLTAITEYLVDPLKRCKNDPDPYVRKTAAICISKLYGKNRLGISPTLVHEEGFLEMLQEMLSDQNPMVISNAVATLVEISELSGDNIFLTMLNRDKNALDRLLNGLNECIEWGQVYILDALVYYNPPDAVQAKKVIEGVTPRFSHINPAVVMSAIKVVLKMMNKIPDKEYLRAIGMKLSAPLVTLSSLEPEIQYVALRSILVVISNMLCIRLELALNSCVNALTELLKLKVNYVTEECTVALRDILRTYPQVFSYELFQLCSDVEDIYGSEAKSALVWIVGQYASQIEDSTEYVRNLSETFHDEPHSVQLSLLTAAIKVHLSCEKPELVSQVISKRGLESRNPDVRDRACMYLKLLESGKKVASKVVLSSLPPVAEGTLDRNILDDLLENLGRVSSVYHLPSWAVSFKDSLTANPPKYAPKEESSDDELEGDDYFKSDKNRAAYSMDQFEGYSNRLPGYFSKSQVLLQPSQRGVNGQLGLEISGFLCRQEDRISLQLKLTNKASAVYVLMAMQFNTNSFGLAPLPLNSPVTVHPGKSAECHVALNTNQIPSNNPPEDPITIQAAIKTNLDVFYFFLTYDLPLVFVHDARIGRTQYEALWARYPARDFPFHRRGNVVKTLQNFSVFHVGSGLFNEPDAAFFYAQTTNSLSILARVTPSTLTVKSDSSSLTTLFAKSVDKMFS